METLNLPPLGAKLGSGMVGTLWSRGEKEEGRPAPASLVTGPPTPYQNSRASAILSSPEVPPVLAGSGGYLTRTLVSDRETGRRCFTGVPL
jgi:hypothetical protein